MILCYGNWHLKDERQTCNITADPTKTHYHFPFVSMVVDRDLGHYKVHPIWWRLWKHPSCSVGYRHRHCSCWCRPPGLLQICETRSHSKGLAKVQERWALQVPIRRGRRSSRRYYCFCSPKVQEKGSPSFSLGLETILYCDALDVLLLDWVCGPGLVLSLESRESLYAPKTLDRQRLVHSLVAPNSPDHFFYVGGHVQSE